MKPNSISGVTYKVKDLTKSAQFYESLGFRVGKQDAAHATFYVNWFWVDLVAAGFVAASESVLLHIKVDSVGECYQAIVAQGYVPEAAPQKTPSGNLEFILRDPDGHQLVFFEKK